MTPNGGSQSPFGRARAIGGLFLYLVVAILAIIDAVSVDYQFELGPMGLMLGTGTVLLGVELSAIWSRIGK